MIGRGLIAAICAAAVALSAGCGRRDDGRETVLLWHAYAGAERAALEAVADEFNASNDDVRIKLAAVPYDAYADKITNAIPNGNGPDLFIFAHDRIGDWVATGLIEPVEFFVDETLADRYAREPLAAMAYRDSLYGLPLAVKSVALFYRTDMVEEPPRSTDELIAWGKQFAADNGGRHALVYENQDLYGHAAWLHGFGGHVFDADGALDLATVESAAAAQFAREIGGPGGLVPAEMTVTMVATLFNEGKAAMAISGPWFVADIAGDVPWGITTLPVVSQTGEHAAPFLSAEGIMMSVRARDKHAAFRVMEAIAGDEAATRRALAVSQVVPNIAAYDHPEVGGDQVLAAFRAQLEHTVTMPATPAMRKVWTPYKQALQGIIARGANPADALMSAQREIQGYIDGASN